MKILGYYLMNIQSWDDSQQFIQLAYDKMNTIIAPSETGKSVVVKILKEMCFPGRWGYTRESLIRRGCEFGTAVFIMEDTSQVVFSFNKSVVLYSIIDTDGNRKNFTINSPDGSQIPYEVADYMGLVIDSKARTVINVLDKDMQTPFINAPEELNARIISVVTQVPEMEKRREVLDSWKEMMTSAKKTLERELKDAKRRYEEAPYVNVDVYKRKLEYAKALRDVDTALDSCFFFDGHFDEEEPVLVECPNLDALIECINISEDVSEFEESIVLKEKPEILSWDFELYDAVTGFMAVVEDCGKSLRELISVYSKEPIRVNQPSESIDSIIDIGRKVMFCIKPLSEICNLKKPHVIQIDGSCESVIDALNVIDSINLDEIKSLLDKYNRLLVVNDKIHDELEKVKRQVKVCPLCGKPL